MAELFTVRRAEEADRSRVSDFYKELGREFDPEVGVVLVAVASDDEQPILGAAWLDHSHGSCVLRKMQIAPAWQRNGVGSALLREAVATGGSDEMWCLPWRHLTDFYARAGFALVPTDSAPSHISSRLAKYVGWGLDIVLMRRDPAR